MNKDFMLFRVGLYLGVIKWNIVHLHRKTAQKVIILDFSYFQGVTATNL